MKSAIIYASATPLTPMHWGINPTRQDGEVLRPCDGPMLYFRFEIVDGDPEDVLHGANPMPGETLLNSVELKTK